MKEINLNINGIEYLIINNYGNYNFYKIKNGIRLAPSDSELKMLFEELQKIDKKEINFDDIKKQLKKEIENKNIKSLEELENYINMLGIVDKKDELISYGKEQLALNNLNVTPTEELSNEIIEEYKKAMSYEKQMLIEFKLSDATVENQYIEVSMSTLKGDVRYDFPKKYIEFNDNTKKKLIEPVIKEIILGSKIEKNQYVNVDDIVNDRVNYFIKTIQNCFVNVKNIESYYAREIEELIYNLHKSYGENNTDERVEEIKDELAQKEKEEMEFEYQNELNKGGPKLIRQKQENKGFANSIIVFIFTEFFAGLLILLQLILLKK